jgi:hypothetical protein
MNRRHFLLTSLAAALAPLRSLADPGKPKRLVLRSSWQTVNIGDIAHTPGVLRLLIDNFPEVEVRLWPNRLDNGVEELLRRRFPKIILLQDRVAIAAAMAECDFLLHGSGPSLVAGRDLAEWRKTTGKPYGIYGITLAHANAEAVELISEARFAFFRDSVSLALARQSGITCPVMEFGPDGAFGTDLRNDEAATAFLQGHNLEEGKFLCVIPRLRHTPYWRIHHRPMTEEDQRKHARSEAMKEHDHAPLREAIIAVVRQTPMKVLVCPEDRSQVELGKTLLVDLLPEDVKAKVVWRDRYWLPDEALSTYVRSAGLFGLEMHSPIMCIGNGIPALVGRFEEQTSKGIMWRDIGLGDWLFDMDNADDVARLVPTVLSLAQDPAAARAKAAKALEFVKQRQSATMDVLRKTLQGDVTG